MHLIQRYYDDLNGVIPTICETLDNILIKCGLSQEGDSPLAVPERLDNPSKATQLTSEALRDVVLYLTDTFQTLFAFLHTLPSLCRSFHRHSFVIRVATFFESFASLMEETRQNQARTARGMWRTAKGALFKLCHVILHTCCIMPLQQRYFQLHLNFHRSGTLRCQYSAPPLYPFMALFLWRHQISLVVVLMWSWRHQRSVVLVLISKTLPSTNLMGC